MMSAHDLQNKAGRLAEALENIKKHIEISIGKDGAKMSAAWNIAERALAYEAAIAKKDRP